MKVCLLSPLPPPAGGIATWTKFYLSSEIATENDVHLINTSALGKRTVKDTRNIFCEIKRFFTIIGKLKKVVKHYDVFHVNSSCSKLGIYRDYCCVKKIVKAGKKVIIQFHCNIEDQITMKFQKKILKKIIKISNCVFVINTTSKKYLKNNFNFDSVLIPNFIDITKKINDHVYGKLKNIVFVGNVTHAKGANLIVEAAKEFSNIQFTLVGKVCDDFCVDNLPENIELIGQVIKEEVKQYLSKADVFLFPTFTEGFPLSVLEAMHEGLPCITSSVGAIPDMLENDGSIYVDLSKESIIKAIEIIYDEELRRKMGEFNFNKVNNTYNLNVVMEKIFLEYKKLKDNL